MGHKDAFKMGCQGSKEQRNMSVSSRWVEEEQSNESSALSSGTLFTVDNDISDESEYESADEFDEYIEDSCGWIQSVDEDRAAHRIWSRLARKDCVRAADVHFWLGSRRRAGFLHSCLRASSMGLDKAYDIAKRFARLRADAHWPLQLSASAVQSTLHSGMHWLLRGRDKADRAVIVYNGALIDLAKAPISEYQKMGSFLMEQAMLSYSTQTNGVTFIADLRGSKFQFVSPSDMKRGVAMWAGAFPCKLKRIVVISPGGITHMLLDVVLGLLDEKIRNRVVVLKPEEIDCIAAEVDVDVLPTSLGGTVDMEIEWPTIVSTMFA